MRGSEQGTEAVCAQRWAVKSQALAGSLGSTRLESSMFRPHKTGVLGRALVTSGQPQALPSCLVTPTDP